MSEAEDTRSGPEAAVLRDVATAPEKPASLLWLAERGHDPETVQSCVERGWLLGIRWHGPEPYHFDITLAGRRAEATHG